jgi:hypothetical protein
MRRTSFLAPFLLLLSACSGSSGDATADPATGMPDPCNVPGATAVPASCLPGEGDFNARPSESGTPPTDAAAISPLTIPPSSGELARGGNDRDPSLSTARFTVVLPAGQRLSTTLACQGAHDVTLTTQPKSEAEQTFGCGYATPTQLTVEDSVAAKATMTFVVTVTAGAPARWYVVIAGTKAPLPSS